VQDKGWGGVERRQFKRAPLSFIITFHIYEPTRVRIMAGGEQYYGMMMDISEHGIAIKTKCDIPVKTSILIRMVLVNLSVRNPSKQLQESEAMGQVRNNVLIDNKLRRLGIQFVRIKEKDRAIIRNFVSKATK
jgi:c-di-GMP-binding flagellar brake protein YcgR